MMATLEHEGMLESLFIHDKGTIVIPPNRH